MSAYTLDKFTQAYLKCLLWSETDESDESGGEPFDANYAPDDLDESVLTEAIEDCRNFRQECAADLSASGQDDEQSGHDFCLTRNRHGAGFWDRGLGEVGRRLTDAAHAYGTFGLYLGDDGKIYAHH